MTKSKLCKIYHKDKYIVIEQSLDDDKQVVVISPYEVPAAIEDLKIACAEAYEARETLG